MAKAKPLKTITLDLGQLRELVKQRVEKDGLSVVSDDLGIHKSWLSRFVRAEENFEKPSKRLMEALKITCEVEVRYLVPADLVLSPGLPDR
jgi:hypothetical protein